MSDESFIALDDITEAHWKEIEKLAQQVLETDVYGENKFRSAIAAFVIWLSENSVGVSVESDMTKRKKKKYTHPDKVH